MDGDLSWRWGPANLAGGWAVSSPAQARWQAGGGEHVAAALDNPPLSYCTRGMGGCVGQGPGQRQKGQGLVSGCHCLGPGLGPEPTGSKWGTGKSRRQGGGAAGREAAAPSHDAVRTPALFCSHSVITEITEPCFRALLQSLYSLFFLFETLRFKKKINIGFGSMPRGNNTVYSLL